MRIWKKSSITGGPWNDLFLQHKCNLCGNENINDDDEKCLHFHQWKTIKETKISAKIKK